MKSSNGFTLLEMLLALALGALLMATISSMVMPLLHSNNSRAANSIAIANKELTAELFGNMDRIAKKGIAVFPTALDLGVTKTSLAIQFIGTGEDTSADANGDGQAGIANMDSTTDRASNVSATDDDDRDGESNEDPINNLDDDNDGLIDEDPGDNSDNIDSAGAPHIDDNRDGQLDNVSIIEKMPTELRPWLPFLPRSLYSTHTPTNTVSYKYTAGSQYSVQSDDNEDGLTNNSPVVTWTARLGNGKIICTTPVVNHRSDSLADKFSNLSYKEYVCLENVQTFQVMRSISPNGLVLLDIEISYEFSRKNRTVKHRLVFP